MLMSDLVVGILLGLIGFGVLGGLVLTAFFLGTGQRKLSSKQSSLPPAPSQQKRRVPTRGTTVPKGGIAQTQFPVSSFPHDNSDKD